MKLEPKVTAVDQHGGKESPSRCFKKHQMLTQNKSPINESKHLVLLKQTCLSISQRCLLVQRLILWIFLVASSTDSTECFRSLGTISREEKSVFCKDCLTTHQSECAWPLLGNALKYWPLVNTINDLWYAYICKAGPCGGNSPNYSSDGVSIKNVNVCTLKKKKKIKYKLLVPISE